jgi:hypothetical protein
MHVPQERNIALTASVHKEGEGKIVQTTGHKIYAVIYEIYLNS